MSPDGTVSLLLEIGNRIDIQWGMFITVHMALFGGIIYVDRPLRVPEKVATLIIYTGFAAINYVFMKNQLVMMGLVYQDIIALSTNDCCLNNHFIQGVAKDAGGNKSEAFYAVLNISHGLMYFLVLLSVVFDQALTPDTMEKGEQVGADEV